MATTTPARVSDRSAFLTELEGQLHHGNAALALALTDLDDFAAINQAHGRDTGDAVLTAWERVLRANVPRGAAVARLGGDEFAVVLPGTSAENAVVLLEELRRHFAGMTVDGFAGRLSASAGIAASPPHGTTAAELYRAAGEALMRAKRNGRDRVAMYVEEKMILKSNYYSKANLERLAKLSSATDRTEASLLREALDDLLDKHKHTL
ncbi:MAG TPA: GGDEF domain-containing protein [Streptosporangiaceae bacterium]|nr:GGDEF domain-containing protein [Streptosporangiaceae bacterium]